MKPILKYSGGKYKELKHFVNYIPDFDRYFECFFGGGATYFGICPSKATIGDINPLLIHFYKDLVTNYFKVKRELSYLQRTYHHNRITFMNAKKDSTSKYVNDPNNHLYYKIRDMFNNKIPRKYSYATLYFFLNKTAYSGMIRYNRKGEFNVPYGRYAHFNTDLLNIHQYKLLKTAHILNESYEKSFEVAKPNDFIFIDPPYDTAFSDYGNKIFCGDFNEDSQIKLAHDFKNLNAPAMMIIASTKLTHSLYHDYIRGSYHKNYSVNIKNRFKSKAQHLIVTNYKLY